MSTRGVAPSRWSFVLASAATATAICLSVLAGWQRGGWLPERLVWVAIGVVLVVSAHLLPAFARSASRVVRSVAWVLWGGCMATACYGHATFFLLAQQHAGERRAAAVIVAVTSAPHRSLTAVMTERAKATTELALAQVQRCVRDCPSLRVRRAALTARLHALNAEADEIRRWQVADDRDARRRDALLDDPVTTRLAGLLGTTVARIDLLSGLAFAAILEGVACLLWTIALQSRSPVASTGAVTEPVTASQEPVTRSDATDGVPVSPLSVSGSIDPDATQLAQDIATGRVRATVADIRRHLGCSQARATALRRQVAALDLLS